MGSGSRLTPFLLSLPLAGLILVLAAPSADVHWEHHPSHFWLVLGTAAISTTPTMMLRYSSPLSCRALAALSLTVSFSARLQPT